MKANYIKILLIWLGIGIIITTYLYLQPEYYEENIFNPPKGVEFFQENYYELSGAITIGVALFIIAIGIKKNQ